MSSLEKAFLSIDLPVLSPLFPFSFGTTLHPAHPDLAVSLLPLPSAEFSLFYPAPLDLFKPFNVRQGDTFAPYHGSAVIGPFSFLYPNHKGHVGDFLRIIVYPPHGP